MIHASAPGKIILFGEHVVVYGHPALAVPVLQVGTTVKLSDSRRNRIWVNAPNLRMNNKLSALPRSQALRSVIQEIIENFEISNRTGLNIYIESDIPVASGLGSGAAVSVALIRALAEKVQKELTEDEINAMAFDIEKLHHGTPSGIDNTVITFAQPVYFIRSRSKDNAPIIKSFHVGNEFTLVIGNTGVDAPTKESVLAVQNLPETHPNENWNSVFSHVADIVENARIAIETGNIAEIGKLMNENHSLLQKMTVSSKELDILVQAAKDAGALGAKLSGGGRGGNMIALVADKTSAEFVAKALKDAGATSTIITTIPKTET